VAQAANANRSAALAQQKEGTMIDYQATNIINAALNLDLRSKNGLEKFTQIVQTALDEAAQPRVHRTCASCGAIDMFSDDVCIERGASR